MLDIVVRQAVMADLEALVPLFDGYRQFYGRASDLQAARSFLHRRFENGQSAVFIAEQAGRAVGFTQLYPSFSSVSLGRVFILNDLFVAESARRMNVGQKLLHAAANYAREVGALRLSLSTAVDNFSAQALYELAGWERDANFLVYNLQLKT